MKHKITFYTSREDFDKGLTKVKQSKAFKVSKRLRNPVFGIYFDEETSVYHAWRVGLFCDIDKETFDDNWYDLSDYIHDNIIG